MSNSQNDSSKCLSGILRRLLCAGSLPTHPSESISTEPNNNNSENESKNEVNKPQAPQTPGIIARLMGLDTLPDFNCAPTRRTLDSIKRSRSANLVHYLPEFDLTQSNHRRVRSSVSFREDNVTFLSQKNSDSAVFSFEKVVRRSKLSLRGGDSEMGLEEELKQWKVETERNRGNLIGTKFEKNKVSKRKKEKIYLANRRFSSKVDDDNFPCKRKSEMGLEVLKQSEVETERNRGSLRERRIEKSKVSKRKGEAIRVHEKCHSKVENVDFLGKNKIVHRQARETLKALNHKERVGIRKMKKSESKDATKKVNTVCNSEDSSPVSVLDLHCVFRHHETSSSGDSSVKNRKPMEFCSSSIIGSSCDQVSVGEDDWQPKKSGETLKHYYSQVLSEISKLTEEGIKESKWIGEKVLNFEDIVEEICTELGQQILDHLLFHQLIKELVGCDINKFEL